MDVRSLGFRTDLALLGLDGSRVDDRGDHLVVSTPDNPGFWWGNFLLLADLPAADEVGGWLDRHARAFPGATHVALGFDTTSTADLAGFAGHGLEPEALTVMSAHAVRPSRRRHATAVNRALATDLDWEQSVGLTLSCFPDEGTGGYEEFVRTRATSNRRIVEAGHGRWFGAFVDGVLRAQLGLFDAGAGLARFQAVETDPQWRRQGLAAGLVHDASRYGFDELRASTLVMVADPEYVAIDLYRALGFADGETQLRAAGRISVR